MPSDKEWDLPRAHGATREMHSDDVKIDQRRAPIDADDAGGDVILVDKAAMDAAWLKDFQAALAFNEEPVTIRLEPSSDRNAAMYFEVWCNGQGAETFQNNRWVETTWLPVATPITIKRKILEIIARTKVDRIETPVLNQMQSIYGEPDNRPKRFTSSVRPFSVIEDRNPRGAAWLTEILRRNY